MADATTDSSKVLSGLCTLKELSLQSRKSLLFWKRAGQACPVQCSGEDQLLVGGEGLDDRSLEVRRCWWGALVPPELHHQDLGDRFRVLYLNSEVEKQNQKRARTVTLTSPGERRDLSLDHL